MAASGPSRSLLVFNVGADWFAVDALATTEITELQGVTRIPRAPAHIPGIIQLRDQAIPLLDLVVFFGREISEASPEEEERPRRVVVVSSSGMNVGIVADQVRGLHEAAESDLKEPEGVAGSTVHRYSDAQFDDPAGLIVVLSLNRLLEAARVPDRETPTRSES